MTEQTLERERGIGRSMRRTAAVVLALLFLCTGTASADLSFETSSFDLTEDGQFSRQAGGHPDFTVNLSFPVNPNAVVDGRVAPGPDESVHSVDVDLPPGMVGNPNSIAECDPKDFARPGAGYAACPLASQVGWAEVLFDGDTGPGTAVVGVFNLAHAPDIPARFGFNYLGTVALIDGRVRPGDYGISAGSVSVSQALAVESVKLTLWGVPADPSHDNLRGGIIDASGPPQSLPDVPRLPFLSAPTSCTDTPVSFTMRGDSWQNLGVFDTRSTTVDSDGTPFVFEGCDRLPFAPSIEVGPSSRAADGPSGLDVDLQVPQSDEPDGLATAHVRRVAMTLPEGMSVSPSSAAGLGACAPAQIGLGTNDAPTCPDSAKLGEVTIDTPVLEDPLEGEMILATQNDNPFGSLLALYLVVEGPGFHLKLPGRIDLDQATGQLTAIFDNTPQLPFSRMRVKFLGGPRASLATPARCGAYNTHVEITSWASDVPVSLDSPTTIDQNCAGGFSPSFAAGVTNTTAGATGGTFAVTVGRRDGEQVMKAIRSVQLPEGLLGKVASVPLCGDAQAAAGTCAEASRLGHVQAAAGPGDLPLWIPEAGKRPTGVFLTGPYKGAPYGLSIVVPAQAGPFDLGTVVVRSALRVDPRTAAITAETEDMPHILEGIPLRLREIRLILDRAGFMLNPTSCATKTVDATIVSLQGTVAKPSNRFQVGECARLAFTPKLGVGLEGRKQMRSGGHPTFKALLTQKAGQANIAKAKVTLPKNLVLDSKNAYDPKLVCDYDKAQAADCPASSVIGRASLKTPILAKPLTGAVHLVQGIRFGPTGNRIRTLPTLLVKLRGEVAIDLRSKTSVDSKSRLVSTFPNVPDAPAARFALRINGGRKGILTVTENRRGRINLCNAKQTALVSTDGQNGKDADFRTRVKTPCAKRKNKR
jgi:hypothetical protein